MKVPIDTILDCILILRREKIGCLGIKKKEIWWMRWSHPDSSQNKSPPSASLCPVLTDIARPGLCRSLKAPLPDLNAGPSQLQNSAEDQLRPLEQPHRSACPVLFPCSLHMARTRAQPSKSPVS